MLGKLYRSFKGLTFLLSLVVLISCGGGGSSAPSGFLPPDATIPDVGQVIVIDDVEGDFVDIELNWFPPFERENGMPFLEDDILGYRIYRRSSDGSSESFFRYVTFGLDAQFTISDLPRGDHYFSITTIDSRGLESDLSDALEIIF